jgi:hypothetical protein
VSDGPFFCREVACDESFDDEVDRDIHEIDEHYGDDASALARTEPEPRAEMPKPAPRRSIPRFGSHSPKAPERSGTEVPASASGGDEPGTVTTHREDAHALATRPESPSVPEHDQEASEAGVGNPAVSGTAGDPLGEPERRPSEDSPRDGRGGQVATCTRLEGCTREQGHRGPHNGPNSAWAKKRASGTPRSSTKTRSATRRGGRSPARATAGSTASRPTASRSRKSAPKTPPPAANGTGDLERLRTAYVDAEQLASRAREAYATGLRHELERLTSAPQEVGADA